MEATLTLIWMLWTVTVPMPDMGTCYKAVIGARGELNPIVALCRPTPAPGAAPVERPLGRTEGSITHNTTREQKNDTCVPCLQLYPSAGIY